MMFKIITVGAIAFSLGFGGIMIPQDYALAFETGQLTVDSTELLIAETVNGNEPDAKATSDSLATVDLIPAAESQHDKALDSLDAQEDDVIIDESLLNGVPHVTIGGQPEIPRTPTVEQVGETTPPVANSQVVVKPSLSYEITNTDQRFGATAGSFTFVIKQLFVGELKGVTPMTGKLVMYKTLNGKTTEFASGKYNSNSNVAVAKTVFITTPKISFGDGATYKVELKLDAASAAPFKVDTKTMSKVIKFNVAPTATEITTYDFNGGTMNKLTIDNFTVRAEIASKYDFNQKVEIQQYNASTKTWSTVKTYNTGLNSSYKLEHKFARSKAGTFIYRIHVPATEFQKAATSKKLTVKRIKTATKAFAETNFANDTYVPWVIHTMKYKIDTNGVNKTLYFQVKVDNGAWKTIAKKASGTKAATHTFKTLKGDKNSKATSKLAYRVYLYADDYHVQTTSNTKVVKWENPIKYTGHQAKMYKYASKYCANVRVRVNGNTGGSYATAAWGKNLTTFSKSIPVKHERTAALHECAHHLQAEAASRMGYSFNKYSAAMDKIYGPRGIEKQADCIANLAHPNTMWGYGNTGCGGKKGTSAKAVLNKATKGIV